MNTATTDTGLATRKEESFELAPTAAAAEKMHEIQSAIVVAKKFPRNEDTAYDGIIKACKRPAFAEDVCYSYPRGDDQIEGPSVYLAREMARVWGNIRHGLQIIRDTEDTRQIRAFAWDTQTNAYVSAEDEFAKLVYRKAKGTRAAGWVAPDERDLRELTNRRGAILVRNCILSILPSDFIEDAIIEASKTLKDRAAKDPDGERKKIVVAFSGLGISPEMLAEYLKHPLATADPNEIAALRKIFASIRDGNSKWAEYVSKPDTKPGVEDAPTNEAPKKEGIESAPKRDKGKPAATAPKPGAKEAPKAEGAAPATPTAPAGTAAPTSAETPAIEVPADAPMVELAKVRPFKDGSMEHKQGLVGKITTLEGDEYYVRDAKVLATANEIIASGFGCRLATVKEGAIDLVVAIAS